MAAINIRRDVKDSFYRYKMPKLISKVEGRGNGIRTVVPNMSDIAKSLNRPPAYPTKFFGCELGAQTKLDDKNDRYIVNGAHDADKLQDLLDVFINKFVLCGECQNPETDLIVSGKDSIIRNCKACGKRTVVDMRHKLTTFILKNPPPPPAAYGKKSSATSAKKEANGNGGSNEASAEEKEDDGDELTKKIQAEAATLVTKLKDDDDDDWAEDTSKEAQEARLRELEGSVQKKLILGEGDDDEDDEDGSGGNKYEKFGIWLEESDKTSISDKEVVDKATELGIFGKHRAVQVLVQVLFDEKIMEQLPKRLGLLHKFVTSEKAQKSLLGGLERFMALTCPKAQTKTPFVLKSLYDADILDEAVILKWGEKPSKKYVDKKESQAIKKAAEPFLEWLKNAEEEESEEESESE